MSSCATTKERILEAAEELMLSKSFHSVGLNEILTAVRVPKGSFYHYFESKEQFGVELLRHYVRAHTARTRRFFDEPGINGLEKFRSYYEYIIGANLQRECRQSCLVCKLSAEVASFSEGMREVLADGIHEWTAIFEAVIREGQADGSIRGSLDPGQAAAMVQDLWQGAMQRMQVEKSVNPLRAAARFIGEYLAA